MMSHYLLGDRLDGRAPVGLGNDAAAPRRQTPQETKTTFLNPGQAADRRRNFPQVFLFL